MEILNNNGLYLGYTTFICLSMINIININFYYLKKNVFAIFH